MEQAHPNRLDNLRTLRYANVDMAFATAFLTLTTGVFLVGFIKSLGGSDLWIGVLTALPSLVGILQIPGAIWGRSFPSFKRFVWPGGMLWRVLFLPLVILPLLPLPDAAKLTVLTVCIAVASAAVVVVNPVYNDWLAEMVPTNSRGAFFARRNAIAAGVGATVGIVGAIMLDRFRATGREAEGFTFLFGLATVCGIVSYAAFLKMRDIPRPHPVKQNVWEGVRAIKVPFADRGFRRVLIFLSCFIFAQAFAGNLFGAFAIETLKLEFKWFQMAAVMHALGNVLSSRMWGFLSDKFGNKPVLFLSGLFLSITPIPWLLCTPGNDTFNITLLLVSHVFMGAIWSAVGLCQFNLMLATADERDRANYIGATMAVQAIVGGISPLVGAALMSVFRGTVDSPETAYKLIFGTTMALRFGAVFLLLRVREEGSQQVGAAFRQLVAVRPGGVVAMRNLTRSADAETRRQAIEEVGSQQFSLAADEIIKALHDPQPRIRREAAVALARLGDPRGTEALLHQLAEHPDLVEEETLEALGDLGDPSAVASLAKYLHSPSSIMRRAAARALGRVGSSEAIPMLREAARVPGDLDLRRAALQALRVLGATEAAEEFADALFDPHPSVRIAAAEAVADLNLRECAPNLRQAMEYFEDEASSELAYALGAVGSPDDAPRILHEAQRSVSIITRRRCLLGLAALHGVEAEVYRLLLVEGMPRDQAISTTLTPFLARNPEVRTALERYSRGDEHGAVVALREAFPSLPLAPLIESQVDEVFTVAAALVAAPR